MMMTHSWIDHYIAKTPKIGEALMGAILGAVQFDCGSVHDMPLGKDEEISESRAPYPLTLIQFETPLLEGASHEIILWREMKDGDVQITLAQRHSNKQWFSIGPAKVAREPDGSFTYEVIAHDEHALKAVKLAYAKAKNLFYVLGCTNVELVNNHAPASLNKNGQRLANTHYLSTRRLF